MNRPDKITLIADDYAMNAAISERIRALLMLGKIDGTSCMTNAQHWPQAAQALFETEQQCPDIQIGLHFCLTEPWMPTATGNFTSMSLNQALASSCLRIIDKPAVAAEFSAQLDAFTEHYGRLPDFIDGHQHVHSFPVIRDAIFEVLKGSDFKGWIRQCSGPWQNMMARPFRFKALILHLVGSGFCRQLQRHGYPSNSDFCGIYDFSDTADYEALLQQWLKTARRYPEDTLIMCHPGDSEASSNSPPDPIASARTREFSVIKRQPDSIINGSDQ
ncbi:MAG: ChbG/HpnK family deacetylase [Amphritea sp.]|nr:ChbG/HpnK family deacetylase [Amphritea sp.]